MKVLIFTQMNMRDTVMNNQPYVYVCTHKETNEIYIGARCANKVPATEDLGTHYFTSSNYVKPRFNEFSYEIIFEGTKEEVFKLESELIKEHWRQPYLINKNISGEKFYCDSHSEETKSKMSESLKGKSKSEEHKQKISESSKGKIISEEHKRKLGESMKGKSLSEETKSKMSESSKGKPKSEEHKIKMSENHSKYWEGKSHSEETKQKIAEGNKGKISKMKGKSLSEETKQKMSETRKGKSQEKVTCPHCDKEGGISIMKRHHFDNCKEKK
jgi:hypothetical protein